MHSLPAKIGVAPALWFSRGLHVITIGALVLVGRVAELGAIYVAGVTCVAALLVIEQSLVKPNDLSKVNLAFFTINGVVGVVLGTLGVVDVAMQVART